MSCYYLPNFQPEVHVTFSFAHSMWTTKHEDQRFWTHLLRVLRFNPIPPCFVTTTVFCTFKTPENIFRAVVDYAQEHNKLPYFCSWKWSCLLATTLGRATEPFYTLETTPIVYTRCDPVFGATTELWQMESISMTRSLTWRLSWVRYIGLS